MQKTKEKQKNQKLEKKRKFEEKLRNLEERWADEDKLKTIKEEKEELDTCHGNYDIQAIIVFFYFMMRNSEEL